MDVIIGLGGAGCRIADEFAKYPQYEIYKIDTGLQGENCYSLPSCKSPEEYEQSVPDMSSFFKDIDGDILFIIGGGGKISGASLQIMKQLSKHNLHVLYVKPYIKSLTKTGMLQDRAAFSILQEYARSGLLKKIFLIDNTVLEKIIGDIPILEYNKKLNELIVNAFHYINVFNHTQPVLENVEPPKEVERICTIGIYDLKNNNETTFFNIENVGYKCYYYAIPEQILKSDGKLFKLIKDKAAEQQSSYRIYTTKHEDYFSYFVAQTNFIQSIDTDS